MVCSQSALAPRRAASLGHEVGVFWDYENVPLPSSQESAAAAARQLARVAQGMGGRVVELNVYHDSEKQSLVSRRAAAPAAAP